MDSNHYGNEGYTNFTPALVCELGSLVGLGMRNTQMRWLPPTLSDSDDDEAHGVPKALPDWDNLYLFVNEEEGSRLYLRRGFGSSFDVSFAGISGDLYCLGYGAKLVEALDKDDDHEGRLACVAASEYKGGDSLIVHMDERVGEEEQTSRETVTLSRLFMRFDMDSTSIPSAGPDDPELFKIRLRRSRTKAKQGFTSRFVRFCPSSGQASPHTNTTSSAQVKIRFRVVTLKVTHGVVLLHPMANLILRVCSIMYSAFSVSSRPNSRRKHCRVERPELCMDDTRDDLWSRHQLGSVTEETRVCEQLRVWITRLVPHDVGIAMGG